MVEHQPTLRHPYYADHRQPGAVLHRYLDDQFVTRFSNQALADQLRQESHSWLDSDRFGDNRQPSLRLPLHRSFYLLCCEVNCELPGHPALDPSKIESAGFVIRQRNQHGDQRWMVQNGIDLGWQSSPHRSAQREPDDYRYLLQQKLIEPQSPTPAYSGEQSYPLAPLLVTSSGNQPRKHTLLYGFVPLSGQYTPPSTQLDTADDATLLKELNWPLGSNKSRAWDYKTGTGHLIRAGQLQTPMAQLLALLVERFHLFDRNRSANRELITLLNQIPVCEGRGGSHNPADFKIIDNLHNWLSIHQPELEAWLSAYHQADDNPNTERFDSRLQLFISESQAESLRLLLLRRTRQTIEQALNDLPQPRYERGGIYYAEPFLRYRDAKGCLKICWGPPSIDFRVATPFDPNASRPHLIQMPELSDLKQGLASGAAMQVPKSLADMLESFNFKLDDPKQSGENRTGSGWMYIFSIPIISICAMILLMLIIGLLNFIFRWIPWVILRIPIPK